MDERVGLWLIGAKGGVAMTTALGWSAMRRSLAGTCGLVSELEAFRQLDLLPWNQVVIGGHEIRETCLAEESLQFQRSSRAFSDELVAQCADDLKEIDQRVRLGILENNGSTITGLAHATVTKRSQEAPRAKVERIKSDLIEFASAHELRDLIVVNLASTEPCTNLEAIPGSWSESARRLDSGERLFPSSSLYAIAAIELGHPYINFTPSLGCSCPAIYDLAETTGGLLAGQDGKTGETLMKSVLAPAFAARNLKVMSWVGHNIFGNLDGKILDDPENKRSKIVSKDRLLGEILGYQPQTHVSIEYIQSLGDWKTAWDHIHFSGFLGTPMTLQFTWQGCDSVLAAPLVLDLFRFTERAHRAGQSGILSDLACFFKSPLGAVEQDFSRQFQLLEAWARRLGQSNRPAE